MHTDEQASAAPLAANALNRKGMVAHNFQACFADGAALELVQAAPVKELRQVLPAVREPLEKKHVADAHGKKSA